MENISTWYQKNGDRLRLVFVVISGACLFVSLLLGWTGNASLAARCDPAWAAIVLCGVPIVLGAIVGLVRDHDITADVLVALALIGSLILKEFFAAGEVAFIMQVGSILEDFTSERAKKGISRLIKLSPQKANLYEGGLVRIVDAAQVRQGDIIQVLAGEAVPVDGKIIRGCTSVDQSAMTGESVPVEKNAGDLVMSGTINQSGVILIEAMKSAEDSSLQRMIRLAESADAQKARIVRKANVWAAWLVVISLATAIIAGIVIGRASGDAWLGFERAVTVLVVFCPCAFVLATPTAISAGSGISFDIGEKHYYVGKVSGGTEGSSLVGVREGENLLGIIHIQDAVKEGARGMMADLKSLGIRTAMLTGDNENVARIVAETLGVDDFVAGCSPEDKMRFIKKQESEGHKVAMFGDGVNDSLALRSAFAGIAMGGIGSDVAIESADAVIVHDNLDAVPYLFRIARKTQRRITLNLCISMLLNFAAVFLAVTGVLNTVWGALFHNCGSVLVVISAFLLLFSEG